MMQLSCFRVPALPALLRQFALVLIFFSASPIHSFASLDKNLAPPTARSLLASPSDTRDPAAVPEGLAAYDWASIRAAYEAGLHAFQPTATGWYASNPSQRWRTSFDRHGFIAEPQGGGWQWGLELVRYGFGENQLSVDTVPAVHAEGTRLSYQWNNNIQEWFVNDHRGLEHGFTLRTRPAIAPSTPHADLSFILNTRGTLHPVIENDSQGVAFTDALGITILTYGGLKVWDADGQVLASRFEAAEGGQVRLVVDEHAARYPITIDPIAQQAYLKASAYTNNGWFGRAVAISGDTVVVSGQGYSCGIHVFVRSGTEWTQQASFAVGDPVAGISSIALDGDTLIVGNQWETSDSNGVNSTPNQNSERVGAAYIFVRTGTTWTQEAYLKASNPGYRYYFGSSVGISGNTVVVGSEGEGSATGENSVPNTADPTRAGAAYIFTRSGTEWTQQAYLKASNTQEAYSFGTSVGISGDTVVVGSPFESSSTTGVNSTPNQDAYASGAAYVFVRNGIAWTQEAYLKASNPSEQTIFGQSVAVSGNSVVVGSPYEKSSSSGVNSTPNELSYCGAAYVFVRNGSTWAQEAYLKATNPQVPDNFGSSVAIDNDTVAVGAVNKGYYSTGATYVFTRTAAIWSEQVCFYASHANSYCELGYSVAISGDTVVSGATGDSSTTTGVNSIPNWIGDHAGAAYVYVGLGPTAAIPHLSTPSASNLAATGATLGADVIDDGGDAITERGVVYSKTSENPNPFVGGTGVTSVVVAGDLGAFAATVSNLQPTTSYSFKCYATNGNGRVYTSPASAFTTLENADLSYLSLSSGSLDPYFNRNITSYTVTVPYATSEITLSLSLGDSNASAILNGGSTHDPVPLVVGSDNLLSVIVTAQDGITTKTYTITVTRLAPSANAKLASIYVDGATLSPDFDAETLNYTASVPWNMESIWISPSAEDNAAVVTVNGLSPDWVSLNYGVNVITILVTAEDGVSTRSYQLTITRDTLSYENLADSVGLSGLDSGPNDDADGDGVSNLIELALGTSPNSSASGPSAMQYAGTLAGGGSVIATGQPIVMVENLNLWGLYSRRSDYATYGITFTLQFSDDLITWETCTAPTSVFADDGANQIVGSLTPPLSVGWKARFIRLNISIPSEAP